MRLWLAIALGFTLGGIYSIQAHASPDYVCEEGQYTPGFVCAWREFFHPSQAPWDPRPGQSLMDQIPNGDGEAVRVCCGADPLNCKRHQTPRC